MKALDDRSTMLETEHGLVQVAREGNGSKVLSIHGSPGGFDQGLAWAQHLRNGGCELIAPSRPGYLRTPLESGRTPSEQADLYAAMLDTLLIDKVTVLGISSGGPSAVHFAARHPHRTNALLLDAAVLLPIAPTGNKIERTIMFSKIGIRAYLQVGARWPKLAAADFVSKLSTGLHKESRREAVRWVTSDSERLNNIGELLASLAPREFRESGHMNDEMNEIDLEPLPFEEITMSTLITQGTHDAFPLMEHATSAAEKIAESELILVEEGHHGLPFCPKAGPSIERQLALALS